MTVQQRFHEAPSHHEPGQQQLQDMYYYMCLARRLNERMQSLNRQGRAPFVIAGAGQEAAQVGAAMTLTRGVDYLAPYYRDLGMNLVLGMTAREAMLNVLAKRADTNSYGRQMPAHWSNVERRIVTQSSVVATQLLHAAGIALGARLQDDPLVVMACCGEGATSRGDFHEALNFAALHQLPVIFYVQNNLYAISERSDKEMPLEDVAARACAYGMRSAIVDGMDVEAVYNGLRPLVQEAREGGGPALVEAKCYRLWAHSSDDDDSRYREKQEVDHWSQRDPLLLFRNRVGEQGVLSEDDLAAIDERVESEVREAAEWALAQPDPEPADALGHVYREQ